MKKGIQNLKKVFDLAPVSLKASALLSYSRYNTIVELIARQNGFSGRTAAGVFSALSPNNDYLGNLRDTNTLLKAAKRGADLDDFKVSTFGANKRKAWGIANGHDPMDVLLAPKTRNFFVNVHDPKNTGHVTIDGHMHNIWIGDREPLQIRKLNHRLYDEIAWDTREAAFEMQVIPCQFQAVVWQQWRLMHNIKSSPQLLFWDDDLFSSGLGFQKWCDVLDSHQRPSPCQGGTLLLS